MTERDELLLLDTLEERGYTVSKVDGVHLMRVKDFAHATSRTQMSVYYLIDPGNRIRNIKVVRLCGVPFIPVSEILDFPFTSTTKGEVYRYTPELKTYVQETNE